MWACGGLEQRELFKKMADSTEGETDCFDNSFSQQTGDSGSEQGKRFNRLSNILERCTAKCFYPAR